MAARLSNGLEKKPTTLFGGKQYHLLLGHVLCCHSHTMSLLKGWACVVVFCTKVIGGLVRPSNHLWVSEWPSAKEKVQPPL